MATRRQTLTKVMVLSVSLNGEIYILPGRTRRFISYIIYSYINLEWITILYIDQAVYVYDVTLKELITLIKFEEERYAPLFFILDTSNFHGLQKN